MTLIHWYCKYMFNSVYLKEEEITIGDNKMNILFLCAHTAAVNKTHYKIPLVTVELIIV